MASASNNPVSKARTCLDEGERLAYLHAMDVPIWVLKSDTFETGDSTALTIMSQENDSGKVPQSSERLLTSEVMGRNLGTQSQTSTNQQESAIKRSESNHAEAYSEFASEVETKDALTSDPDLKPCTTEQHYLKMVNWALGSDSPNQLLIVCRHQTDQPAQSFARNNLPSQFMQDYVRALSEFCQTSGIDVQIKLAYLSQAGLSSSCEGMNQVVERLKPRAVLLLGEETITTLLSEQGDIASLRGQVHPLLDSLKSLVSYHPYSLIQNPALKALAMEDLKNLTKLLVSNSLDDSH